jgi:hypothetical protein
MTYRFSSYRYENLLNFLAFVFIFIAINAQSPTLSPTYSPEWSTQSGTTENEEFNSIAFNSQNELFACGMYFSPYLLFYSSL